MKLNGFLATRHWWLDPPALMRYAVAVALVGAAIGVEFFLERRWVGAPALLFLCAVMLSGWFGGFRPALSAVALSLLAFVYFFVNPRFSFIIDFDEVPRVILFSAATLVVGMLSAAQRRVAETLHDANQKLESANEALRSENAERRSAEQALRESEQRFRDYTEIASDWRWETGPDHRFISISARLASAGIGAVDRIGQRRWDFVPTDMDEDPKKWSEHIAVHDAHLPFRDFTYRMRRDNGLPVYIRTSGKPLFDAENRFLGYRGVATDITAEVQGREAEQALRQARTELAHVTRVTTLGELTASIVHEVNQPLAAISTTGEACLRFLDRDVPDLSSVREGIVGMIDDSRRAVEVVRRIRALSRKAEPQMSPLNINDLINDVVRLIQREVADHGVSMQLDLASEMPLVPGDRVGLQQVIINLVMNGMEAMADITDRPRHLRIRSRSEPDKVVVAVEDSGVGIQPDAADRLFTSFYTTKPSGLGMGLSICRSIIEAHGGRLSASPNVGPGATFQFSLPLTPAEA
jgi:PAS domain S-box-containing protein